MLVSIENINSQVYITCPDVMPVMQPGRRLEIQPGLQHNIDRRRCSMNTKPIVVHCTYSEESRDISEIIKESFRIFLQKELGTFAKPTHDGVS